MRCEPSYAQGLDSYTLLKLAEFSESRIGLFSPQPNLRDGS